MSLNYTESVSGMPHQIKCTHDKVLPFNGAAYCPDCGKEVKIEWKILRCEGCSGKRKSHFFLNKIVPDEKFCKKCGSASYYIESKENIEFFDYEYAIIQKDEVDTGISFRKTVQVWIEEDNLKDLFRKPKMIPVY